jgi:hypothetical protein
LRRAVFYEGFIPRAANIRLKPAIDFVLDRFFVIPAKFRASRE